MTWLVISVCCPFASPVTTTRSTSQSCGSTSPVGTDSSSFASTSRGETFAPCTLIGSALPKPRPTRNFSFAMKSGGKAILNETWRMPLSRNESGNIAHSVLEHLWFFRALVKDGADRIWSDQLCRGWSTIATAKLHLDAIDMIELVYGGTC